MPKSRKFIDKKRSVSFQLVHRSQQDPLVADETAPQHVLLPTKQTKKLQEEHQKYGIYYNDDYNYLQHLKDRSDLCVEWPENVEKQLEEKREKLILPSSVFASKVEEDVGMLNKAAPISGPQLHLDVELVAAMDEDFDYNNPDNQLEDNFIELANGVASDQEFDEEFQGSDLDSEELDEVNSLPDTEKSFNDEETKSRFTTYSMTSSVMRRNEQLTLLDDRFEQMYANYDENEIGPLDCEEIEGHVAENSQILLQCADEFEKEQTKEKLSKDELAGNILERLETSDKNSEEDMIYMEVPEKEKWDCESILSTYSNIYNHPKLISEPKQLKIKISNKTGMPINEINPTKLTIKSVNKLNEENATCFNKGPKSIGIQSVLSQLSTLSVRPKNETPDEKKERKKSLKEYRKERRIERKLNTMAFKEEAKKQAKIEINNRNNLQGNKVL